MGLDAKVGSFNIDSSVTAGNDQAVTGVGFQPKIVIFWWGGSTATSDTVAGGDIHPGFGVAISSSDRYCFGGYSQDAQATSAAGRAIWNSACIVRHSAPESLDGAADFKSLDANGFTLTIDNQFSVDQRISYLALGGSDLTDVYLGDMTSATSTGEHSETGVGFQPDAVILVNGGRAFNSMGSGLHFWSMGWATGSSNQGVISGDTNWNQATSYTFGYGYNAEIIAPAYNRAVAYRDTFVSFDADGFTLDCLESYGTGYSCFYVCLKGGQYAVGDLSTRTDGNDIEEGVGFEPAAVLFASVNRALSTQDSTTIHNRISIGAGTSASERAVQAISDEDGLADTETAYTNQDDAVYAHVVDDAIVGLMDLKSMDADGFTCVMDDTDPSACWVTYLAIGAEEAAGETLSVAIVPTDTSYYTTGVKIVG